MAALAQFLQECLLSPYHARIPTWLQQADAKALSGAKLLKSICRTRGNKRLKAVTSRPASDGIHALPRVTLPFANRFAQQTKYERMLKPEVTQYLRKWASQEPSLLHEKLLLNFFWTLAATQPRAATAKKPQFFFDSQKMQDFEAALIVASPKERKQLQARGHRHALRFIDHGTLEKQTHYRETYVKGHHTPVKPFAIDMNASALWRALPSLQLN